MRPLLATLLLATLPLTGARSEDRADAGAVLVELFTSQGCSSCPPADRLLGRIAAAGRVGGVEVVPLAFHVDYWNQIGWRDPFSSRDWSDRQRAYATAMDLDTIYTPQIVLDGRRELVGSDERELRRLVRELAARRPVASLDLEIDEPRSVGREVVVRGGARLPAPLRDRRLLGMLALVQDGLVTPVSRGENARRTLRNERVVRGLHPLFELGTSLEATARGEVTIDLAPEWPRRDLTLVLFLQDPVALAVEGVTTLPVEAPSDGH